MFNIIMLSLFPMRQGKLIMLNRVLDTIYLISEHAHGDMENLCVKVSENNDHMVENILWHFFFLLQ